MTHPTISDDLLARLRGFAYADAAHAAAEHALSALAGPDGAMLPEPVRLYLLALVHERRNAAMDERDAIAATFQTSTPARGSDFDLPVSGRGLIVCDDLLPQELPE